MRTLLLSALAFIALAVTSPQAEACEACNAEMKVKLLEGKNLTLAEEEMLRSMKNTGALAAAEKALEGAVDPAQRVAQLMASNAAARNPSQTPAPTTFPDVVKRDARLKIPQTGWVPQDSKHDVEFIVELAEGETYIGNGVMFKGFTTKGKIPGPTFFANEGDIVKFTIVNKGGIPHGASLHAAYTQTSKYLGKVQPGTTTSFLFRATYPGIFMYHCAPGGHAIPIHVMYGQYGMMVVKPKKQFKLEAMLKKAPDVDIYLLQHELYANGKDAIESKPIYTAFNGKTFRYVEEPIKAKPGDYVRINYLNVGPNQTATFHIVGIVWDFAYWQGHPDNVFVGGQTVTAGPSDSWVVEFRAPPDEGAYLMLSHAVGPTDRGAIGILQVDKDAKTPIRVLADGPSYTKAELDELKKKSLRTISPFEPGTLDVDPWVEYPAGTKEVTIQMIGNSFYPKRVRVPRGTTIKWVNEDVFSYLSGEFSGIHNVVVTKGPDPFASPMLSHAQSWSKRMTAPGKYEYICAPHPYMKAEIEVR